MAEIEKPDTPTNVVDDVAKQNELIDNFVNSIKTEGNLEFYVKHTGNTVSAGDIKYNPTIGKGSQIPGFYTEPLGIRDIKIMGGRGGADAVSNYYKVQVNSNNLLVDAISGQVTGTQSPITGVGKMYLGDQINKIDWNIFEQETGLNFERDFVGANKDPLIPTYEIKNGKKFTRLDVQTFIRNLESKGLTGDQIASALRKSGIEGFATGPINAQYEVVLIDPNDDLGIGSKLNIEDATEVEFLNNQSKVNQIDELVIKPTNVVDDIKLTDTPGGSLGAAKLNDPLVFDSWIDNLGKTTTSFVDNLPLETIVKNRVKNLIAKKSAQAATPGGFMDAVDAWEFSVLGLMVAAVAFKEYDEIPTIITNKAVDMFNSMTSFYGIPPVQKKEYDLDYEYITKVLDTGEKFLPTDIIINKGVEEFKEGQEAGIDISAGLGAQAGVFNNSITTPAKTDTMETTQKIQPGVQENKIFEQAIKKENFKKSMKTQYQSQVPKEAGSFEEVILKSKEKTKPKKSKSGGGGSGVKIL